ncbi:hypothetical protein JHN59_37560, partial [Streptomyces sp. MBT49]|uniref:hypothetical protein n=1 Tax=Streptomyces sp. MBT49 TaxID=1488380 RepID=UPI00190DE460
MTRDTTVPTPAAAVPKRGEAYDRLRWEQAVIASSLQRASKHVALTLAHYAGDTGYLPAGGPQHGDTLSPATGFTPQQVRQALGQLEHYRLISRPHMQQWDAARGASGMVSVIGRTPRAASH